MSLKLCGSLYCPIYLFLLFYLLVLPPVSATKIGPRMPSHCEEKLFKGFRGSGFFLCGAAGGAVRTEGIINKKNYITFKFS